MPPHQQHPSFRTSPDGKVATTTSAANLPTILGSVDLLIQYKAGRINNKSVSLTFRSARGLLLDLTCIPLALSTQSKQGSTGQNAGYSNGRDGTARTLAWDPNGRSLLLHVTLAPVRDALYERQFGDRTRCLVRTLESAGPNDARPLFKFGSCERGLTYRVTLSVPAAWAGDPAWAPAEPGSWSFVSGVCEPAANGSISPLNPPKTDPVTDSPVEVEAVASVPPAASLLPLPIGFEYSHCSPRRRSGLVSSDGDSDSDDGNGSRHNRNHGNAKLTSIHYRERDYNHTLFFESNEQQTLLPQLPFLQPSFHQPVVLRPPSDPLYFAPLPPKAFHDYVSNDAEDDADMSSFCSSEADSPMLEFQDFCFPGNVLARWP